MKQTKHTPGPWEFFRDESKRELYCGNIIPNNKKVPVCRIIDEGVAGVDKQEWEANAALIAAAPDLLKACKAMFKAADEIAAEFIKKERAVNWGIINDAYSANTAAIAKAEPKRSRSHDES